MTINKLFLLCIAVIVLAAGLIGIATATQHKSSDASCSHRQGRSHFEVTIQNNTARPDMISGRLCDSITFTNKDNVTRELAFGAHENHVPYDGVTEDTLRQNNSVTITLDQVGNFHFHDHAHDEVSGSFSVSD